MAEVDKVSVKFDADVSSFSRGVNKMERDLDNFNKKAERTEKNVNMRFDLMDKQVNKLNKTLAKTGDDVDMSKVVKQIEHARNEYEKTGVVTAKTMKNINAAMNSIDMTKMSEKSRKAFNTLNKDVAKLGQQTKALKEIEFAKGFEKESRIAALALHNTTSRMKAMRKSESELKAQMDSDSFKDYRQGLRKLNNDIIVARREMREMGTVSRETMNSINTSIDNVSFKELSGKASSEFAKIKREVNTLNRSFSSINISTKRSTVYMNQFVSKTRVGLDAMKGDFAKTIVRINRIGTAFRNIGEVAAGAFKGIILSVLPAIIPIAAVATTSVMAIGSSLGAVAGGAVGLGGAFGIALVGIKLFASQGAYALKMLEDGTLQVTNEVLNYQGVLEDLKATWEGLIAQNQAQIFNTMTNGINAAKFALVTLNPFLTQTAKYIEDASVKLEKWVTSSDNAKAAFDLLNQQGPLIFQNLLNSAGYFGDGMTRIFTAFGPLFTWTAQGIENLSKKFNDWANSSQAQKGIEDFINYSKTNLPTLGSIFGNTFLGIIELFKAFSGQTEWALGGLDNLTQRFRNWAETLDETQSFKDFISYTRANAPVVGQFIGNLVSVLVEFIRAAAPVGEIVLKISTAFLGWIAYMMKTHPFIAQTIGGLVAMSGALKLITIFLGLFLSPLGRLKNFLMLFIGVLGKSTLAAKLFGLALRFMTGPIGIAITVIGALVGALIYFYKNNETFRNFVNNAWNSIKNTAVMVFGFLRNFIINVWNGIKTGVLTIFNLWLTGVRFYLNLIRTVFTFVWNGIKNFVVGAAVAIYNGVRMRFNQLSAAIRFIISTLRNFLITAWSYIKNAVVGFVVSLYNNVRMRFNQLSSSIRFIITSLRNFLFMIWNFIRTTIVRIATSLFNGVKYRFNQLSAIVRQIIANLKSWLTSTWNTIKSNVTGIVSRLWTSVRNTFNRFSAVTKEIFRNLGGKIRSIWNGIKDAVVDTVGRLWSNVKRTFNNMKNGISTVTDKIKGLIGGLTKSIKGGINAIIKGINKVGGALDLKPIPTLSTGTSHTHTDNYVRNGKIARGTFATVGDKGRGNGRGKDGRREIVTFPNGRSVLTPNTDTTMYLPKGTTVTRGKDTQKIMDLPRFHGGSGGSFGESIMSGLSTAKDWIVDKSKDVMNAIGDVMDYATNPKKLFDKIIGSIGFDGFKGLGGGVIGDMARGFFGKMKKAVIDWFTKGFESMSGGDGGVLDMSKLRYYYGHTEAYTRETGRPFHEGLDFDYIYEPLPSTINGTAQVMPFNPGGYGNWVKIVQGAMEVIYAHLSKHTLKTGQKVKIGDTVGISGNSGFSTGPHLHYEMRWNGRHRDPLPWLKKNNGRGRGAGGWAGNIRRAASRMGVKVTERDVRDISSLIQTESGGRESIIQQIVDINTGANRARGLLQYTPGTFASYKVPGAGNIMSGMHQLLAFFNNTNWRRDLSAWQSRMSRGITGWGPSGARRRENGGIVNSLELAWLADGGFSESVISHDPANKIKSKAIWDRTGEMLGYTDDYELLKELVMLQRESIKYNKETEQHTRAMATQGFDISMDAKKVGVGVAPYARTEINRLDKKFSRY
ncbi:peptidoglycan DD-metalloendopeptidase family protein [Staphylococcus hyicus]|uniref:peptidoglycan DD-metalloendopeptidase family protein n=1 Tax=Staphylococcus hyicus TaxID=1284 RepID=UPI002795D3C7|nr:peptidoglycan DD-metalloendopeptidase family protein [Staphylococcus hyicus]